MPEYLHPGVYVEEVPGGARPIEAVGTSTAGLVGVAPRADARVNEAVFVTNWTQFADIYMPGDEAETPLAYGVYGFFANGGRRLYVVNTGKDGALSGNGRGLDVLARIDGISLIAAPGQTGPVAWNALLDQADNLRDRFALLDSALREPDIRRFKEVAKPPAASRPPASGGDEAPAPAAGSGGARARQSDDGYGAQFAFGLLVPSIRDPRTLVEVHPSGHIAGLYARVDGTRGVHKAPANETIRGALDVTQAVTDADQDVLNPASVNAIRFFAGEGVKLYGARTLADRASEYRYVNVRRLLTLIRLSIERGTRWVVFEPNDERLWVQIRRDVAAFLTILWRSGALMGATPEEAFFVRCDGETNTQADIDNGRLVCVIGVAPVKPAEFVIFRIGQMTAGSGADAG